jgi:dTDP-4-dehydrorhamnose reductase
MSDLLERPLILGARGQLGTDLGIELADRNPVMPDRRQVDLEDPSSLAAMLARWRPSIVINAAAYTNVDHCELHPDRALAINALAVERIARLCALAGTPFAHVSTDYVFAGSATEPYDESDEAAPINVYGISKLGGELLLKVHGARWFIFRTSGLYGTAGASNKGYTFIDRILGQAQRGEAVRVVDDITFSPSYTVHVAQAMRAIIESGRFGLYHVTNTGTCTWHEFAREAFAQAGLTPELHAIKSADFPSAVARPPYSVLGHGEIARARLRDLPSWQDGLRDYLAARR